VTVVETDADAPVRAEANVEMRAVLDWAWDVICEPVLNALGPATGTSSVPCGRSLTCARDLAADFYRHLTREQTAPPDAELAAASLHRAVRSLRARQPSAPSQWAPYTHTGP
jgi:hypothetical protein